MNDDLVDALLPIFMDKSVDDEDRYDQAWALLKKLSPKKGDSLHRQRVDIFMRCREIVEKEVAARERYRKTADTEPLSRGSSAGNFPDDGKLAALLSGFDADLFK